MSRNERTKVQEPARQRKEKPRSQPDTRIRRTCEQLGSALMGLIQEKPVDDMTVQGVLDRAGVGRSIFYLHYRDKNDLLLSQLEMFLEMMSTALSVHKEKSHRVVPVVELFAHIGRQNELDRALADADRLNEFFELAQGYFGRGIAQRQKESGRLSNLPERELAAHASALAGSMLALFRWWLDRGAKESPQAMDEVYHRMVWNGLQ